MNCKSFNPTQTELELEKKLTKTSHKVNDTVTDVGRDAITRPHYPLTSRQMTKRLGSMLPVFVNRRKCLLRLSMITYLVYCILC